MIRRHAHRDLGLSIPGQVPVGQVSLDSQFPSVVNMLAAYVCDTPNLRDLVTNNDFSAGNIRVLTPYNAPAGVCGPLGRALSFDGSTTYLNSAQNVWSSSLYYSFIVWARITSYPSTNAYGLIGSATVAGGGPEFRITTSGTLELLRQGIASLGISTGTVPLSQICQLAVTVNDLDVAFYINGNAAGTATAGSTVTTGQKLLIGLGYTGEYFNGLIDHIKIFSAPLTATDIATDYLDRFAFVRRRFTPLRRGLVSAAGSSLMPSVFIIN